MNGAGAAGARSANRARRTAAPQPRDTPEAPPRTGGDAVRLGAGRGRCACMGRGAGAVSGAAVVPDRRDAGGRGGAEAPTRAPTPGEADRRAADHASAPKRRVNRSFHEDGRPPPATGPTPSPRRSRAVNPEHVRSAQTAR